MSLSFFSNTIFIRLLLYSLPKAFYKHIPKSPFLNFNMIYKLAFEGKRCTVFIHMRISTYQEYAECIYWHLDLIYLSSQPALQADLISQIQWNPFLTGYVCIWKTNKQKQWNKVFRKCICRGLHILSSGCMSKKLHHKFSVFSAECLSQQTY